MRKAFLRIPALICLGMASACADAAGPEAVSTYVTRTVDGRPLPVSLHADATFSSTLVADTISLFDDGTFRRASVRRYVPAEGPAEDLRDVIGGRVLAPPGTGLLVLDHDCDSNELALCTPPDVARRRGQLLEIERSWFPGGRRYVLQRIDQ